MTKTKKNLRPQQVAPVQRETTANSSTTGEKGVGASVKNAYTCVCCEKSQPFAGDDAE